MSDFEDDMCPNCVTPWKCNGPHVERAPDSGPKSKNDRAVELLDSMSGDDPEGAHSDADLVLLGLVDPEVADAYRRLVARCRWWACA